MAKAKPKTQKETKVDLDKMVRDMYELKVELEELKGRFEIGKKVLLQELKAGKGFHIIDTIKASIIGKVTRYWSVADLQEHLTRTEFQNICPRKAETKVLSKRMKEDKEFARRIRTCYTEKPHDALEIKEVQEGGK